MKGADPTLGCNPEAEAPGGVGSGKSLISFTYVFDGKLDEPQAAVDALQVKADDLTNQRNTLFKGELLAFGIGALAWLGAIFALWRASYAVSRERLLGMGA